MIQKFLKNKVIIPNEKLLSLYNTFQLDANQLLPPVKPSYLPPPFKYHSLHNRDTSYIDSPRLSITKLLTSTWCELRDYYEVYSGSMRTTNESLILGSKYHELLELEDFEIVNIEEFEKYLIKVNQRLGKHDVQLDSESKLANDWFENIIFKLFSLLTKSDTRELLVHDYLNIDHGRLERQDDSIMISGIIDLVKLFNPLDPHDYSMFEEIQAIMELNRTIKLNDFLGDMKDLIIINDYGSKFELKFTDIKTRQLNQIPRYKSVLQSAYLQVCYYKVFFEKLSHDHLESFKMLNQNAKVRHCDIDKPIDIRMMLGLLRKYPDLLLEDFKLLANGTFIWEIPPTSKAIENYDLTGLITANDIEFLNGVDNFDYNTILGPDILRKWEIPLTLRYFSQVSGKFYNIFKPFRSHDLSIEYHNVRTNYNFETLEYKFNQDELNKSVTSASQFWNGDKTPQGVKDLGKCKFCDFNSRCPVPNKDLKNIGWELTNFLNDSVEINTESVDESLDSNSIKHSS